VLGFERVKKSFEIRPLFARQDQCSCTKSMFQPIPTDDSTSSGRLRASAFFGVSPVRFYLSFSCHIVSLVPKVADASRQNWPFPTPRRLNAFVFKIKYF